MPKGLGPFARVCWRGGEGVHGEEGGCVHGEGDTQTRERERERDLRERVGRKEVVFDSTASCMRSSPPAPRPHLAFPSAAAATCRRRISPAENSKASSISRRWTSITIKHNQTRALINRALAVMETIRKSDPTQRAQQTVKFARLHDFIPILLDLSNVKIVCLH